MAPADGLPRHRAALHMQSRTSISSTRRHVPSGSACRRSGVSRDTTSMCDGVVLNPTGRGGRAPCRVEPRSARVHSSCPSNGASGRTQLRDVS
eukprot:353532-Chlamydomonas_euryale.AAC.10